MNIQPNPCHDRLSICLSDVPLSAVVCWPHCLKLKVPDDFLFSGFCVFLPLCSVPDEFCFGFPKTSCFLFCFWESQSRRSSGHTHVQHIMACIQTGQTGWIHWIGASSLPYTVNVGVNSTTRIWGTLSHLIFVTNIPVLSCLCLSMCLSLHTSVCSTLFVIIIPIFWPYFRFFNCLCNKWFIFAPPLVQTLHQRIHHCILFFHKKRLYYYVLTFYHIMGTWNDPTPS